MSNTTTPVSREEFRPTGVKPAPLSPRSPRSPRYTPRPPAGTPTKWVNSCLECGIDMGRGNPRQLCGKTRCDGYDEFPDVSENLPGATTAPESPESLTESPPTKFVGLFVCDMESSDDFPMLSMILGGPDSRFIYVEGASKEAVWAKAEQVCAEQWEYMCGKPWEGRSYFDQVEVGKVRGGCLFGWEIKEVPLSFSLPGHEPHLCGSKKRGREEMDPGTLHPFGESGRKAAKVTSH